MKTNKKTADTINGRWLDILLALWFVKMAVPQNYWLTNIL